MVFQEFDNLSSTQVAEAIAHLKSLIVTRTFKKEQLREDRLSLTFAGLPGRLRRDQFRCRLEALSVLGKAAEVSVPIAVAVKPLITRALSAVPPQTGEWGNADDRYYFAKAVSISTNEWMVATLRVNSRLLELRRSVSKDVWAELALANCSSIAEAIEEIAEG